MATVNDVHDPLDKVATDPVVSSGEVGVAEEPEVTPEAVCPKCLSTTPWRSASWCPDSGARTY